MTTTIWTRMDEWFEPLGGLAAWTLGWIGLVSIVTFVILPILIWRQLVWSRRGTRAMQTLVEMVRQQYARREKPEDRVARALRERAADGDEERRSVRPGRPPAPAPAPRRSGVDGSDTADHDPPVVVTRGMAASGRRETPRAGAAATRQEPLRKHSALAPPPPDEADSETTLEVDETADTEYAFPEWRAYGFDTSTGVKTSVVVRAASIPLAKRAAERRGVNVTTIESIEA